MRSGIRCLAGGAVSILCATSLAAEAPVSVPGCAQVGAVLSAAELMEIVPGHMHVHPAEDGNRLQGLFSRLESPASIGVYYFGLDPAPFSITAGYRIGEDGVCVSESTGGPWACQRIARCASGEAEYVGWRDGDDTGWTYSLLAEDQAMQVETFSDDLATPALPSVSPRPEYDISGIAPAPDWAPADNSYFRGLPGFVGVYLAEGAQGVILDDYLTAHDYSTGRRADDGLRMDSSLLRLHRTGREPEAFYHLGQDGVFLEDFFGLNGPEADRFDLAAARPGVIDFLTDSEGAVSTRRWFDLQIRVFWTYADWDAASQAQPGNMRVVMPMWEFSGRSVLLCDLPEPWGDAVQVSYLDAGETCRRYDRAFEVTEMLRGRNALQVAAAIGAQEAPLVMQVGKIAVAGDTITIGAAPVPPFVLINTGQFEGWADWIDRTQGTGGRERPVTCSFPLSEAGRLGDAEAGDLLRFRANLAAASDAGVQLECRLECRLE